MADEDRPSDPARVVECFNRHGVEHLIVGGVGAQLHGAHRPTGDFDSLPRTTRENLARVAAALKELNAYLRVGGLTDEEARALPVQLHPDALARMGVSTWQTDAGPVDVLATIPDRDGGRVGYDELQPRSATMKMDETLTVQVAGLSDIIASKEFANREKDHEALPELHQLEAEQRRPSPAPRSHPSGGIAPKGPGPGLPPGLPPTRGPGFSR